MKFKIKKKDMVVVISGKDKGKTGEVLQIIAGDAFSSVGKLEVPNHFALRFPLPYGATWNRPEALETAIALRALDPTLLVLGHGHPVTQPAAEMDASIARAKRAA